MGWLALCLISSRRFTQGEGPSRGLLRDCQPSCGPSFEALVATGRTFVTRLEVVSCHWVGSRTAQNTHLSSLASSLRAIEVFVVVGGFL